MARSAAAAAIAITLTGSAVAQNLAAVGAAPPLADAQTASGADRACCIIPANTAVSIKLAEPVNSAVVHPGEKFAITLAEDIEVGGVVLVHKGGAGYGQVVDSAPAGIAGRAGKLVLAAREVTVDGLRVPLHGFKLSGVGRDNSKAAIGASMAPYAGPILALIISGGNVNYPAGLTATAKTSIDLPVRSAAAAQTAPAAPPPPATLPKPINSSPP